MWKNNINTPMVSVLLPCYNSERYIEQALVSILDQTYINLEVIVIDDCSTDNSLSIIEYYANADIRVKLIRNTENKKLITCLNIGISYAAGKYIARMDADDISLPCRIQKQVEFLERHPEYAICGCNAFHINERNKIIGQSFLPQSNDEIKAFSKYYSPFYHPAVVIRSEVLKKMSYSSNYLYVEDYELWLRLLNNYKCINLKEKLLMYRLHPEQISKTYSTEQTENVIRILVDHKILQNKNDLDTINFLYRYSIKIQRDDMYRVIKTIQQKRIGNRALFLINKNILLKLLKNKQYRFFIAHFGFPNVFSFVVRYVNYWIYIKFLGIVSTEYFIRRKF